MTRRWLRASRRGSSMSMRSCFPLRDVDALNEEPDDHRDESDENRQEEQVGRVCGREHLQEILNDKTQAGDDEESAEKPRKVFGSKDQIAPNQGGDAIEHHEDPRAICVKFERQQDECIQLIRRESLQIRGVSEEEWGSKIEHLGYGKERRRNEAEERRE